ncbi:MAG: GAF domain-containing protein [Deltaproteobacteria bacterium]|nr:GAF domain-containing protein [Deltaproteobacteria bacterium]
MPRTDLKEWFTSLIGPRLDEADWSVSVLSGGALLVGSAEDTEVLVEDNQTGSIDPGGRPRILIRDDSDDGAGQGFFEVLPREVSARRLYRTVRNAHELHLLRRSDSDRERSLRRKDYELKELIEIGKSLSAVKDVDALLEAILRKSRLLVGADAGSMYVVEGDGDDIGKKQLRFKLSQNDSIEYQSKEFVMPVSSESIAGAAAVMKRSIDIPDVRRIPQDASYGFDSSFDERTGYRTMSVLAVPMINQAGEVLGVVQLINKKRNPATRLVSPGDFDREVVAIDSRSRELVETLASQAAVAMENAFLYDEINRIFDGFIRASVHAIEQRDPTTSGHSFRVAALTRGLAEVLNEQTSGPFAGVTFDEQVLKEIETAGLLHDFGKVGVREEVLVKAKKLYPDNLEIIRARFDFIRRDMENDHLQRRLMMLETGVDEQEVAILDQSCQRALHEIDECWRVISSANEPTMLPEGDFAKVEQIAGRTYFDVDRNRQPYLKPDEVKALLTAKGTLTDEELDEIRSHANHTISFLKQIPWGKTLRNIPAYAGAHHEKLDGSGYPFGIVDEEIPLPAKIMAVADIFDALTAADRPYKKAVSNERAFQILNFEVKDGHIDGDLVRLFEEHEVHKVLAHQNDWRFKPGNE